MKPLEAKIVLTLCEVASRLRLELKAHLLSSYASASNGSSLSLERLLALVAPRIQGALWHTRTLIRNYYGHGVALSFPNVVLSRSKYQNLLIQLNGVGFRIYYQATIADGRIALAGRSGVDRTPEDSS